MGIQIVGRYRDDFGVLQIAHAFEQATGFGHDGRRSLGLITTVKRQLLPATWRHVRHSLKVKS